MEKSAKLHFCTDIPIQYRYRKIKSVITALNSEVVEVPRETFFDMKELSAIPTLPLLETPEGNFTQTNTIIRYLANKANNKLYGDNNIYTQGLIDQWLDITLCDFDTCVIALNVYLEGKEVDIEQVTHDVEKYLTHLNKHLKNRKYIVGESLTIADLVIAVTVGPVLANMYGEEERKKYGPLTTWYLNIVKENKEIEPKELPKKIHKKFEKKDKDGKEGKEGKEGKNKEEQKEGKPKGEKGEKGEKGGKGEKGEKQENKEKTKGGEQKDNKKKKEETKETTKTEKKEEDDLFGDDTTPTPAVEKEKKPEIKKEAKKKPAAKSIIIFNVKVYEQEQDLTILSEKIKKEIQLDGIVWNADINIKPIAYGMNMLEMGCVIEDEKVSVEEDIYNKILSWETEVQSVDTVSFQKL